MPGWKPKTDADLLRLAADVLEGLVIGTWQCRTYLERKAVFPGFDGDRMWSSMACIFPTCFETPEAALRAGAIPPFLEAYVELDDGAGGRRTPPFDASTWDLLTHDEWKRLAPLIGSPPTSF